MNTHARQCGGCHHVFHSRYSKIRHQMSTNTPCKDATKQDRDTDTVRARNTVARRSAEKKGLLKATHKTSKRRIRICPSEACTGMFSKAAMALHLKHEHASTQCNVCHKVFCSVATMQRHKREKHATKASERCPNCGKNQKRLNTHKKRCKGATSPKPYQCLVEQCAAACTRERNLTAHTNLHHPELEYEEEV